MAVTIWLCLLFLQPAQAQQFNWVNQLGGPFLNNGISVTVDAAGNIYSTGIFNGDIDMDPGPGVLTFSQSPSAGTSVYIEKTDPAGNLVWARQFTGSNVVSNAIKLDAAGNIYIGGFFQNTTDFDPGPGVTNLTALGTDAYLCKLDNAGNFMYVKRMGGVGGMTTVLRNIFINPSGELILAGNFTGYGVDFDPGPGTAPLSMSSTYGDVFVLKLDAAGNFMWVHQLGGSSIQNHALSCDAAGDIFLTGYYYLNLSYDQGPAVQTLSNGFKAVYLVKLNSAGNFVWARSLACSSVSGAQGNALASDASGNVYCAGSFYDSLDVDPGPGIQILHAQTASSQMDIFIARFDPSGNLSWGRSIGGPGNDDASAIALDANNNVYITGPYSGTVDFNPGAAVHNMTAAGLSDIYLLRLNSAGMFFQSVTMGGTDFDLPYDIAVNNSGVIAVTGLFYGTADFNPDPAQANLTSAGISDAFVVRFNQCLSATNSSVTASACTYYTLNGETYTASGVYVQDIQNAAGCDSLITLHLTITPPQRSSIQANICEGSSFYAGGAWQTVSGIYDDTLAAANGCDSIVSTHLTVNSKPQPDLGPDINICSGNGHVFNPGHFVSYQWQDLSTQADYPANTAGVYWVKVTDANHCTGSDTVRILKAFPSPVDFLQPADSICPYDKKTLIPLLSFSGYHWSTGSAQSTITIQFPGIYWLEGVDRNGCTGRDTILISPKNCNPGIYVPNAFTPNGDHLNDILRAMAWGHLMQFRFEVYNRFGELLFRTTDPYAGWDGTYRGLPLSTNVFTWVCAYQLEGEKAKVVKGTVTLIR